MITRFIIPNEQRKFTNIKLEDIHSNDQKKWSSFSDALGGQWRRCIPAGLKRDEKENQ